MRKEPIVASYKYLGSGTDTITLRKDYEGYVYIAAVPAADYYVHWTDTRLYNPRVEQVLYFDIDGNNIKEFVFKYGFFDIPAKEGYRPKLPFVCFQLLLTSIFNGTQLNRTQTERSILQLQVRRWIGQWTICLNASN